MRKNIVVTGYGIISANGITPIENLDLEDFPFPVGEIKLTNDDLKRNLNIPIEKQIGRTTLLGISALRQAAENADVSDKTPGRKILISGTTAGEMDLTEKYWQDINNHADVMLHHDCGSCTERIAEGLGFINECTTISTACSSGANAILEAAEMLEADNADIVFAGGAEALTKFHLTGFASLMILDREVCRPFADNRAGLNLGEGAAFLVMETEQHAINRGANILCYFAGGGNACDAFHQTASSPDGDGAYLAMNNALINANIAPDAIQYVNAHGTGTVNNDASEMAALKRIFGNKMPIVESTKSITGHTTSAAGAIEAVICIQKLQQNGKLQNVMDNSFGFGGNDTSLIFSRCKSESNADCYNNDIETEVVAKYELTNEDEIAEIKEFLKPSEYRRMGKILRSSLLTSIKALKQCNITVPDAIITATTLGCWENSEKILDHLTEPQPTLFMQSTHNTIGSNTAIYLKCHGYNTTYVQGSDSFKRAMRKAELLIKSGKCNNVLVGLHNETTQRYRDIMHLAGRDGLQPLISLSVVVKRKNQ